MRNNITFPVVLYLAQLRYAVPFSFDTRSPINFAMNITTNTLQGSDHEYKACVLCSVTTSGWVDVPLEQKHVRVTQ